MLLALIVLGGLVAHIVTTVLVGRWLAQVAREEIAQGLRKLVEGLPAPVRAMIGQPSTDNRERVNV